MPGAAEIQEPEAKSDRPSPRVFEITNLLRRVMGDRGLAERVLDEFLDAMPAQIETLRELVEAGRIQEAAKLAHKIKGAAATVGGGALSKLASELEGAAKRGDLATIKIGVTPLNQQFLRLQEAIAGERAGSDASAR